MARPGRRPSWPKLLKAHARHGKLAPVATLRTHRSGVRVADGERSLADVTFDAVDILDNGHAAGNFAELEVELVDGDEPTSTASRGSSVAPARQRTDGQPKLMRVLDLRPRPAPGRTRRRRRAAAVLLDRSLPSSRRRIRVFASARIPKPSTGSVSRRGGRGRDPEHVLVPR